jgi:hypothetical protein
VLLLREAAQLAVPLYTVLLQVLLHHGPFFALSAAARSTLLAAAPTAVAAAPAGSFNTGEEAAMMYDAAAREMRGPAAVCNLPPPGQEEAEK